MPANRLSISPVTPSNKTPGPRSAMTRQAILVAARARFASQGYERASVRAIAGDAGIDPSMVIRYYGSKGALFLAAADIDLRLPALAEVDEDRLGETLSRHFLERWEGGLNDDALVFLLRTAATHEAAAELMRHVFEDQVMAAVASRLGEDADVARRAALVGSQVLGMAFCRYVLRLEPLASMEPDLLVADLSGTIQRYLCEPLPPGRSDTPTASDDD